MIFGYLTFGQNSQALLLNNYGAGDVLATLARFLTGIAILSGYPLMFAGLKSSGFSLFKITTKSAGSSKRRKLSVKRKQVVFR